MSELVTIDPAELQTAEWLAKRDKLLADAECLLSCTSDADVATLTQVQGELGRHAKVLHNDRMKLTRQIDGLKKQLIAREKELIANLVAEKDRLQGMASSFVTKQRQAAEKARREAEERAREAAIEAAEKADERAQLAADIFGGGFDPQLAATTAAPAVPAFEPAKIAGTRTVTRWHFELVDPAKVPAALLILNTKAINAQIRALVAQGQTPEISGLRIWSTQQVQSRG